jgi:hypothetical protein
MPCLPARDAERKELRANKTWHKPPQKRLERAWTTEETAKFDAALTGLLIKIVAEVERREGPLLKGKELEDKLDAEHRGADRRRASQAEEDSSMRLRPYTPLGLKRKETA